MLARLSALLVCATILTTPATGRASGRCFIAKSAHGVAGLQSWYVWTSGRWQTTGWWNAANAVTVLVNFSRMSGSASYQAAVDNTYTVNAHGGFLNRYYDDEGWWALAWIDAYDLTHERRYLAMAQSIFDDMAGGWDETCGGGIWWSKDRKYKNAIANELFLSVAAHLANRAGERARFDAWAAKEWRWFRGSGMINGENLINDGLRIDAATGACTNNGKTVWTYNQGVVLGGLAEWSKAGHADAIEEAKRIADAALTHLTDKDGVLHDPCEPKCGPDGIQFKGIFMRNLRVLNEVAPEARYRKTFAVNAEAIWTKDRTPENTFGTVWSGLVTTPDAGTQSSAVDALVAVLTVK